MGCKGLYTLKLPVYSLSTRCCASYPRVHADIACLLSQHTLLCQLLVYTLTFSVRSRSTSCCASLLRRRSGSGDLRWPCLQPICCTASDSSQISTTMCRHAPPYMHASNMHMSPLRPGPDVT